MKIIGTCNDTSTGWLFVHWNLDRIRIWKCWFLRRGENRSIRRKTSRSREEKQQQTQPTLSKLSPSARIDPEPHRWRRVLSPLHHPYFLWLRCTALIFNNHYLWALILMISQWSSYENKHTHRGVVPWYRWKESQRSIQRCRELVCSGWANCLMKTKLKRYSWLSKNDNKSHVIEGRRAQPFG